MSETLDYDGETWAVRQRRGDTLVLRRVRPGLAGIRTRLGLTQREMAALLGINHTTLHRYEVGTYRTPEEIFGKAKKLLRKSV